MDGSANGRERGACAYTRLTLSCPSTYSGAHESAATTL